ncbi:hypothetical protein TBR22_A36310 [Luteitalea sp. TBR-22]|uniref:hypothetical protein n=1 Tax=Luteitalea sp. TBR-22 TaxID=2802971 RepID=UPI001AFA2862|nr:hypothetical protein [Luteitalea sp. TBR-22]BCS34401.1 hypothetical protein TBR22_A36310 [Luteitalea sp. TBR-22]
MSGTYRTATRHIIAIAAVRDARDEHAASQQPCVDRRFGRLRKHVGRLVLTALALATCVGVSDAQDDPGGALTPPGAEQVASAWAVHTVYLAEGATSAFFDTRIALLNPGTVGTNATVSFLQQGKAAISLVVYVPARTRVTVEPRVVGGLENAEYSTRIESDQFLVVDRMMWWEKNQAYGAHAETGVRAPALKWYLAEGATQGPFNLFYLIQNPNASDAQVLVRYLRPSGSPIEKIYTLPPNSRGNIWVDLEEFPGLGQALSDTAVSAVFQVLNNMPIIVERAMYADAPGQPFGAGHESAGITEPATEWFFAEGATGTFFDLFILLANPSDRSALVEANFLLPSGEVIPKQYTIAPNSRFNIWVDLEDSKLASTSVSTTIRSTNGVPLVAERTMWWPEGGWYEAHNSAGATAAGTRWAVAEGEVDKARTVETYYLIANVSDTPATLRVSLLFDDGRVSVQEFTGVAARSRFNVPVGVVFPDADGRRFGALIESTGPSPANIVVERAMYWDAAGQKWAAGTNALGTVLRDEVMAGVLGDSPQVDGSISLDGDDEDGGASVVQAATASFPEALASFGVASKDVILTDVPWRSQFGMQNDTCGSTGALRNINGTCGHNTAAMAIAHYKKLGSVSNDLVKSIVLGTGKAWECGGAVDPDQLVSQMQVRGVPSWDRSVNAEEIVRALEQGHPLIVLLYPQVTWPADSTRLNEIDFPESGETDLGHYMLVIGITAPTPTHPKGTIIVHDGGRTVANIQHAKSRAFELETFLRAWHHKTDARSWWAKHGWRAIEVGRTASANASVTGDFSLTASPSSVTVRPGATAELSVLLESAAGMSSEVALSVEGIPGGQSLPGTRFKPTSRFAAGARTGARVLQVSTNEATPKGSFTITVVGRAGATVRTSSFTLNVQGDVSNVPVAITASPNSVTKSDAALAAMVTPNGLPTNVHFEWGATNAYGKATPPVLIGSGHSAVAVSTRLTGLPAGTEHHFRVVAVNSAGRATGDDRKFLTTDVAAPSTPVGLTPGALSTPGPTTDTTLVRLAWEATSDATWYGVAVRDFTTDQLVVSTTVSDPGYLINLGAGGQYRWNANACNSAGCSPYAAPVYFTTRTTAAVPATPAGATPGTTAAPGILLGTRAVTMTWGASTGASTYQLALVDMTSGATVVDTSVIGAAYTMPLSTGRLYRWNVAACNAAGCSAPTPMLYVTTPAETTTPATPGGASPGATANPGPTLASNVFSAAWAASSGATSYNVVVRDSGTDVLVVDAHVTGTAYAANLGAGRTYRWNVAACNSAGCSRYTAVLYFTTPTSGSTPTKPATPPGPSPGSTSSPGPTTGSSSVTVGWGASSGAANYGLAILDVSTGALVVDTYVTGTSYTASLSSGRTYRWNVAACNSAGCSSYTAVLYFTTPTSGSTPTKPATPTGPSPGSTSSPGPTAGSNSVTVGWGASSGAANYGLAILDVSTGALVVDTYVTGTSYTASLSSGRTYRWNVAACNSAGCSSYTAVLYFTTPTSGSTPTKPATPTSPSPGSISSPGPTTGSSTVTIGWGASSGATNYGVAILDVSTGALVVDTYVTGTSYTSSLSSGRTYRWNAAACNSAGCSLYTTALYFTTPTALAAPSVPSGPSPGSTSSPGPTMGSSNVTVGWGVSSGATSYGLGIRDMTTNALVVDTYVTGTSHTALLTAGRTYRWNVSACNAAGCSLYTTGLYFTTPSVLMAPTTPTSPSPGWTTSPGPTMGSNVVTVSWGSSSGATSHGIGIRDMTTNTLVVDTYVTGTSYTASLTRGRTYKWNVAACNAAGCSGYTTPLYFKTP